MDRRFFLKMSSMAVLSAAGAWTGISKAFAQSESYFKSTPALKNTQQNSNMELRKLRNLDVSAIGLGCLPMVGYYGGKYDEKEMIALIRRAYDSYNKFNTLGN